MAKKVKKVSKKQQILDYSAANPNDGPSQVAAALSKQGLDVSAQYVSNVWTTSKSAPRKPAKRGRKPGKTAVAAPAAPRAAASKNGAEPILQAKKLAESLGGIDRARAALDALEAAQL